MPASAGGSSKVRPACRSRQDTAFDERRQDRGARASVRSPQPLGLGDGEAQSRHFAVLALDSQKQFTNRPRRVQLGRAGGAVCVCHCGYSEAMWWALLSVYFKG